LATWGLLRPKAEVPWGLRKKRCSYRGDGESVVFLAHIERGFGVPTDDFFRGLLYFYRIELVPLVPNTITIISSFIHLCEAYLGIPPHFRLWRHFLELKKTGKSDVVGSVGFMLRRFMNLEYIDLVLPDNSTGWKQGWFYLDNTAPALPVWSGRPPVLFLEWTNQLTSRETEEQRPLLEDVERLKIEGLAGGAVAISFSRRCCSLCKTGYTRPMNIGGNLTPSRSSSARSPRRRWQRG
jgi:hypothetical protein